MDALDHPQVDVAHYTYRVTWSAEDSEYVATCLEFPSLSWLAGSRAEAIDGLEQVVADVVEDMASSGDAIPEPLSERRFSGTFNVRIGEHLHRDLVMLAAEEHLSLNQYVIRKLASSQGAPDETRDMGRATALAWMNRSTAPPDACPDP